MSGASSDRGSVTTEVAIVAPLAIMLLCLVAFVGRSATANGYITGAARDAARSASLERDPAAARQAATDTAATSLAHGGFTCATHTVEVDTARFAPGGQVAVTVRCELPLSDLGLLGLSGTRAVTSTAVSVVDLYRATR